MPDPVARAIAGETLGDSATVALADGSTLGIAPVLSAYIIRVRRVGHPAGFVFGMTPGEANALARALSEAAAAISDQRRKKGAAGKPRKGKRR